jgi:hypothetical protein
MQGMLDACGDAAGIPPPQRGTGHFYIHASPPSFGTLKGVSGGRKRAISRPVLAAAQSPDCQFRQSSPARIVRVRRVHRFGYRAVYFRSGRRRSRANHTRAYLQRHARRRGSYSRRFFIDDIRMTGDCGERPRVESTKSIFSRPQWPRR